MPTDTCPPRIADIDFAAARERDVVDAPRRHADGIGDEAGQDLIAAAGRSAAPRDRLGPFLERADEIVAAIGTVTRREPRSTSYSPVSRAIGVTSRSVTGDAVRDDARRA